MIKGQAFGGYIDTKSGQGLITACRQQRFRNEIEQTCRSFRMKERSRQSYGAITSEKDTHTSKPREYVGRQFTTSYSLSPSALPLRRRYGTRDETNAVWSPGLVPELHRVAASGANRERDRLQRKRRETGERPSPDRRAIDQSDDCLISVVSAAVDKSRAQVETERVSSRAEALQPLPHKRAPTSCSA